MTEVANENHQSCGRPTRSGKPCKIRISGSDVACGTHTTEHDRAVAEAHRRGYREGYDTGHKRGANSSKSRTEWLEKRIKDLDRKLDDASRFYEVDGDQAVDVGGYAYRWRGDNPLEVGDRVLLPENYVSRMKNGPGPTVAVVSELGTTYRGALALIIGRAPANDV